MKVVVAHRSPNAKISEEQYERFRPDVLRLAAEKGGMLTSQDIVDAARDQSISFHEFIYRDTDGEAARKWRLSLARDLMQSFHVTFVDSDGEQAEAREFVSVPVVLMDESQQVYIETAQATATVPFRAQQIVRCLTDLKALERRYSPFMQKGKSKAILVALKALIAMIEGSPEVKKSKAA